MTRDGLTEENLRDGSVKDISHRSRGRPENKKEFVPERERKKAVQSVIIIRDFFITMQFLSISGYFFFRCDFNCILNSFLPDRRFPDLFHLQMVILVSRL